MKNLLLLLNFFSVFIFSQEYHFDYFIQEKHSRFEKEDQKNGEFELLFDSADMNKIFFKTHKNKTLAVLNDKKKNIRHIFRVSKENEKYLFFYKHSNRLNNQDYEKFKNLNKENVITAQKIDSLKYKILVFNNSTLRRINLQAIITLVESDFNYLEINADYNRSDEMKEKLKEKLPDKSKFKISKIEYLNRKGNVFMKQFTKILLRLT